jgi:four helix bundle protein
MSGRPPENLSDRCFDFACDAYDFCEQLVQVRGLAARIGYQLWDAASSVGANRAEAKSSYSNREFAVKNSICLKEARESLFWLRIAERKNLGDPIKRRHLISESDQLVAIYVTTVRKLQQD